MLTDRFIALSECDTTIFDNNIIPFLQTYFISTIISYNKYIFLYKFLTIITVILIKFNIVFQFMFVFIYLLFFFCIHFSKMLIVITIKSLNS